MKNRPASATRSSSRADAVSMLMQDHKTVQKLFRDFHKAHDNDDEAAWQIAQREEDPSENKENEAASERRSGARSRVAG